MRNLTRNSGGRHTADWFDGSDEEEVLVCTAGWGEIVKCGLEAWLALSIFLLRFCVYQTVLLWGVSSVMSLIFFRGGEIVNHFFVRSLSFLCLLIGQSLVLLLNQALIISFKSLANAKIASLLGRSQRERERERVVPHLSIFCHLFVNIFPPSFHVFVSCATLC